MKKMEGEVRTKLGLPHGEKPQVQPAPLPQEKAVPEGGSKRWK
jgi:hypothetical protein